MNQMKIKYRLKEAGFFILFLSFFIVSGCYDYNLKVISDNASLRSGPGDRSPVIIPLKKGEVIHKISKNFQWYFVEVEREKNKKFKGYVYRDNVSRVHSIDGILSSNYKSEDNLALMITLPVVFVLVGGLIAASEHKKFNLIIILFLIFLICVQTIYITAVHQNKMSRLNTGFRMICHYLSQSVEKNKAHIYYTDYTWPARIEVFSRFQTHFDRFAVDAYNRESHLHAISSRTDLSKLQGVYVITDSTYYETVMSRGWTLPESITGKIYPQNWQLVMSYGNARLFFAR